MADIDVIYGYKDIDTFTLEEPPDGALCFSATCRNKKPPVEAVVRVTYGSFPALPGQGVRRLWPESWGKTIDMCENDWLATKITAQESRPSITIRHRGGNSGADHT